MLVYFFFFFVFSFLCYYYLNLIAHGREILYSFPLFFSEKISYGKGYTQQHKIPLSCIVENARTSIYVHYLSVNCERIQIIIMNKIGESEITA